MGVVGKIKELSYGSNSLAQHVEWCSTVRKKGEGVEVWEGGKE